MKDWIAAFVEEVIAWLVFLTEMVRRWRLLVVAVSNLEQEVDLVYRTAIAVIPQGLN